MAGIYVRLEGDRATLGGYVRASGQVTILGIVTLSADFFLQLSYQTETKKAIGALPIVFEAPGDIKFRTVVR